MRTAVIAFDTRGGVQPYVALSRGLQDAGHDVTMITTADFADLVTGHGIRHAATTGDTQATVRRMTGAAEMSARERNRFMRDQMRETVGRTAAEVLAGARGADLVLGGIGGSLTGRPVAERLGVPFVEAHLQPLGPPSDAFPGPLLPQVPSWLGGAGRRASHRVTAVAVRTMLRSGSRQARAALDLPPVPVPVDRDLPAVYGFSPLVVPHPGEWGERRAFTGYWRLPAPAAWTPPPGLVEFLTAGPPPVCVGFGSMTSRDPAALGALVLTAARRAGHGPPVRLGRVECAGR